ncbi:flagellin [Desulfosporosinus acididurans]|nr:flagellin [Desulfosporosinus acididurans]
MFINSNMGSLTAQNNLNRTENSLQSSLAKLSSGYRINSAADDAAGLAISQKMTAQVNGLNQANRNAQDAISLVQTAEGAMGQTQAILQRMRQLAVQSANDTNTTSDRTQISLEVKALQSEITRIANTTQFNTKNLINGSLSSSALKFQIGANGGQTISLNIATMTASGLKVDTTKVSVTTRGGASVSIGAISAAIDSVSSARAKLGALENRLNFTMNNLTTAAQNLSSAQSQITNVDMASEMSSFTQNQVLAQAGTAMLAQANQTPQMILKLLQ